MKDTCEDLVPQTLKPLRLERAFGGVIYAAVLEAITFHNGASMFDLRLSDQH